MLLKDIYVYICVCACVCLYVYSLTLPTALRGGVYHYAHLIGEKTED